MPDDVEKNVATEQEASMWDDLQRLHGLGICFITVTGVLITGGAVLREFGVEDGVLERL